MLDIKELYMDTRLHTDDRNSGSDLFVELLLAVNIPDKCICYIDDVVSPVSWTMIDSGINILYVGYRIGGIDSEQTIIILLVIITEFRLPLHYT